MCLGRSKSQDGSVNVGLAKASGPAKIFCLRHECQDLLNPPIPPPWLQRIDHIGEIDRRRGPRNVAGTSTYLPTPSLVEVSNFDDVEGRQRRSVPIWRSTSQHDPLSQRLSNPSKDGLLRRVSFAPFPSTTRAAYHPTRPDQRPTSRKPLASLETKSLSSR